MQVKKIPKAAVGDQAVTKTIDGLIEKAVIRQATDIHIEPRERNVVVRFRLEGSLHEIAKLPTSALGSLLADLKSRAGLNVKEYRRPQYGSFRFKSSQYDVSLYVATMPTIDGEKLSIHLNPDLSDAATLENLGYWGDTLQTIVGAVAEPHGLILVASPDRTGASLTLLGIAHLLNDPSINIVSLENPIGHRIPGISQTELDVASGVDFSTALQAVLKQDVNVVVVTDIHDTRTADVALDAAIGGHLLLGGLYVNDAAYAVSHLARMRGEPYIVASALKIALGQSFVRRLCLNCRETYSPDETEIKAIKRLLKSHGISTFKRIHELDIAAAKAGLGGTNSVDTTPTSIGRLRRVHDGGCPECNFSGFTGRIGANEVLGNSEKMEKLIARNASSAVLQKLAVEEGMVPLQIDGLIKALRGLTTLEMIMGL